MIDGDLHIRLTDFGLALLSDAGSSSMGSQGGGGTRWTAPEVLNGKRPSCESDVYAFGCVCVEVNQLSSLFHLPLLTNDIGRSTPCSPLFPT